MSNALARTYADALFEIAKEENILDEILSQTKVIAESLADNKDFLRILDTPTVLKEEKNGLIDAIFAKEVNKYLLNTMKVMVERNDGKSLLEALTEYETLYNNHFNIEKAVAITAVPLSDTQKDKLIQRLEGVTGKKIILTNKVDESVIGGVILEMEGTQFNDSIAAKLRTLKSQLKV